MSLSWKVGCRLICAFCIVNKTPDPKDSAGKSVEIVSAPHNLPVSVSATTPACHTTPLQDKSQMTEPPDETPVVKEAVIPEVNVLPPESTSNFLAAQGEKTVLPSNVNSRPILPGKPPPSGRDKPLESAKVSSLITGKPTSPIVVPSLSKNVSKEWWMGTKEHPDIVKPKQGMEEAPAEALEDKESMGLDTFTDGEVKPGVLMTQPGIKEGPVTMLKPPFGPSSVARGKGIEPGVHHIQRLNMLSLKAGSTEVTPLPLVTKQVTKKGSEPQPKDGDGSPVMQGIDENKPSDNLSQPKGVSQVKPHFCISNVLECLINCLFHCSQITTGNLMKIEFMMKAFIMPTQT